MARQPVQNQLSNLLETLPGIASVLRSPVADALVNMIRAGAGTGTFKYTDADELIQYGTRRGLLGSSEGESLLEELKGFKKRSRPSPKGSKKSSSTGLKGKTKSFTGWGRAKKQVLKSSAQSKVTGAKKVAKKQTVKKAIEKKAEPKKTKAKGLKKQAVEKAIAKKAVQKKTKAKVSKKKKK